MEDLAECNDLGLEGGRVEFLVDQNIKSESQNIILPAMQDFLNRKLDYPEPFYLFAAEPARAIRFFYNTDDSCLKKAKSVNVYGLTDL